MRNTTITSCTQTLIRTTDVFVRQAKGSDDVNNP